MAEYFSENFGGLFNFVRGYTDVLTRDVILDQGGSIAATFSKYYDMKPEWKSMIEKDMEQAEKLFHDCDPAEIQDHLVAENHLDFDTPKEMIIDCDPADIQKYLTKK